MATETSHGFVLWAVPRFRRRYGVVQSSGNAELAQSGFENRNPVSARENVPIPVDAATALENPDLSACLNFYRSAYHRAAAI